MAVAVDLKAGSNRAVERALAVASDAADRITLLHVVPGFSSGVPPHLYRYGVADYQSQLVRDARRGLQLAVPAQRESRAAIHTRVLRGDTSTEISRVVSSIGADLLIVGVPRRGLVARALFGTHRCAPAEGRSTFPCWPSLVSASRAGRQESVPLPRAA